MGTATSSCRALWTSTSLSAHLVALEVLNVEDFDGDGISGLADTGRPHCSCLAGPNLLLHLVGAQFRHKPGSKMWQFAAALHMGGIPCGIGGRPMHARVHGAGMGNQSACFSAPWI